MQWQYVDVGGFPPPSTSFTLTTVTFASGRRLCKQQLLLLRPTLQLTILVDRQRSPRWVTATGLPCWVYHSPVTVVMDAHATRLRDHAAARPCPPTTFRSCSWSCSSDALAPGLRLLMLLLLVSGCVLYQSSQMEMPGADRRELPGPPEPRPAPAAVPSTTWTA